MKLYFKDEQKKLRVVDTGEIEVDLSQQKALKDWLEVETNIRVKSPILTIHTSPRQISEPMVA